MTTSGPLDGPTVVLGVGNPLLADDGAGLVLLERLRARRWPDPVPEFVDGGTWGMSLLPDITAAARLLVLDAVRTGDPPGTVVRGEDDDVPRLYTRPASPHQVDLKEVLAAATLLGQLPPVLVVVGVAPEQTDDLHVGLTPAVEAALDRAEAEALRVLSTWGLRPQD